MSSHPDSASLMTRLRGWLFSRRQPIPLGSPLPQISVTDHSGTALRLPDSGWTFLYFYPRADTPGCTRQACSLRDAYESLIEEGVMIFGASLDPPASLQKFREKHHLPFALLADTAGALADAGGVPRSFGFTRRQAFLFKDGLLVWRDLEASTDRQAQDALAAIRQHA